MAILKNLTGFEGTIGNITAYKRSDSDKIYLRTKGGISKNKVKKDEAFARTRKLNNEWSGCSKAATIVRNLLSQQQPCADYNLAGALTAIAKNMQARIDGQEQGKRPILFSHYGQLLEGFQLNRKNSFESIIRGRLDVQVNRAAAKVVIQLPELIPGISFIPPVNLPLFQLCISFGNLPDMHFFTGGYAITEKLFDPNHFQTGKYYVTPWYQNGAPIAAQTIEFTMEHPVAVHPTDAILVAISVNFGTAITDQLIKTSKHAGAGKIWKVELGEGSCEL